MLKNRKNIIIISTIGFLFAIIIFIAMWQTNSIETLSKYGSRGNEVTQIQTKLKRWGYYTGSIDGIYGSKTVEAVKYFQRKNGLTVIGKSFHIQFDRLTGAISQFSYKGNNLLESPLLPCSGGCFCRNAKKVLFFSPKNRKKHRRKIGEKASPFGERLLVHCYLIKLFYKDICF